MKLLVCYEMTHNKGISTGDSIVTLPHQQALTEEMLGRVRGELREACEASIKKDGLVPLGKLIFRSITRLDG